MLVSLVPSPTMGQAVYQVLDDIGKYGQVWSEIADKEANEQTIIRWIMEGQFRRPLKVIAFNTEEGWSRDVSREIAWNVLELSQRGTPVSAPAIEFVERLTGESPVVAV